MSLSISCPSCSVAYRVSDDKIGKQARCKVCGTRFSLSLETRYQAGLDSIGPREISDDDRFLREARGAAAADPDELSGAFGRYEIVRILGKGGMGAVYLAKDTMLGSRLVALKVPLPRYARDPNVLERFKREARIGQEFRHDQFCAIYEMGEIDGRVFLSMAYIEGETLSDLLKRTGRLSERRATEIVRKLATALADAHDRDIIHRDLKPSNIMIDRLGKLHIMDFGLAKRFDSEETGLTATDGSLGTPAYMPPEQVKISKALIGPRSDVYSLGVILYQLLTGRLPYEGNAAMVFAQILSTRPPTPLQNHREDVDPAISAACLKAIAKKPIDRYESMRAFAEALTFPAEPQAPPEPSSAPSVGAAPSDPSEEILGEPPEQGESLRWIGLTALAAGVVLVLTVMIGSRLTRDESSPPIERPPGEIAKAPSIPKQEVPKADPAPAPVVERRSAQSLDVMETAFKTKLVLIPAGRFARGSPTSEADADSDEKPRRDVTLTKSFWLSMCEITQSEYREVTRFAAEIDSDPSSFKGDNRPVERVSWFDAVRFCNEASRLEGLSPYYQIAGAGQDATVSVPDRSGLGFRLPTEAEWEYACRAGSQTRYHFGDDDVLLANHGRFGDLGGTTQPVGILEANAFKLKDMLGNVLEWCQDAYDPRYYERSENVDCVNDVLQTTRVARGGSFADKAEFLRSAYRDRFEPRVRHEYLGIRIARTHGASTTASGANQRRLEAENRDEPR